MDDEGREKCPFCREYFLDRTEHCNTVNHRYNFKVHGYNEYRKALVKDRHGIVLEVINEVRNNFQYSFNFRNSRGKYVVQVTPEQLYAHDSIITFKCKLKNTRTDDIYVTNINLLHSSDYFSIIHRENCFTDNEEIFYKISPGGQYTFRVEFSTKSSLSSYKIPLSCDFQTLRDECFTIIRTFLVIVDDEDEVEEEKMKSPFTSKPLEGVKTYIETTENYRYQDRYPIPKELYRILNHGLNPFDNMSDHDEQNLRRLTGYVRQLTQDNYAMFWHTLLWLEERGQAVMLIRYNMEQVTMELIRDDTLVLEVPGLAEKRPSVVVGDYIQMRVSGDHTAYKGFVKRVNDKTIEIAYVDEELLDVIRTYPDTNLDVAFQLGRLSFERMHHAVDRVVASGMVRTLFPQTFNIGRNHTTYRMQFSNFKNQEIVTNEEQRNAVMKIVNSVQTIPYIVFGPPGTGKTVTILEAIYQLKALTKKRILVCAPANSACDLIAQKLIPYCTKQELIRVHSSTREINTVSDVLRGYSNIEEDGQVLKVNVKQLMSYRIVVTTLILIGKFKHDYCPDCVFIDEAAQASEPESNIALSFLSPGKLVVLAGDPMQLGPMVTDCAQKFGLGISLLERLMQYKVYKPHHETGEYNTNFITMLKKNFRSHPKILEIPNQMFYDNNLVPVSVAARMDPIVNVPVYLRIQRNYAKGKKKRKEKPGQAIEFYSISSKEKREGSSPSYFNLSEAKMVVKCVRALLNLNLGVQHRVSLDQIGVVTPYKRQVHKILEGLKRNNFEGVEVGTTESFQGREKRIIIISTVRAQHALLLHDKKYNLGFVKHNQRFNVAVTRAISKLIVIGCPLVLTKDEKWEMYITECKNIGSYFGDQFDFNESRFRADVITRMNRFKDKDDQYRNGT